MKFFEVILPRLETIADRGDKTLEVASEKETEEKRWDKVEKLKDQIIE